MMRLTRGEKPERYGGIFYSISVRHPKGDPLYVARNEAIGVPLLPLRQPGHGKVKHRDGYLVQVANRQCVEYVEPHRKAMIEVDFGNSVGVYMETLNGWLREAGISPMSATDRERVISGIVAGLEAMGRVKRVERSLWNSNPKRSESLRRFAERLRRTRVENAENVASSGSFLGILGKKSPKPSACWRFCRIVHPSILAPARKSYRGAPVLSRGISFNRLDGSDRLLLAQSGHWPHVTIWRRNKSARGAMAEFSALIELVQLP